MNKAEELKETGLTKEQQLEFFELKRTWSERGFLLPDEKQRYDELFHIHAQAFVKKMKAFEEINRLVMSN